MSTTPLLLLLLLVGHFLVPVTLLGIPLPSLENQYANQHESKNSVARRQHLEAVLAAEDDLAGVYALALDSHSLIIPETAADGTQTLDNVGNVHGDPDEIENQRRAVEEEVGLARAEELDEEAKEADRDNDVEQAPDQRRRLVYKAQVRLQLVIVARLDELLGPQEGEVVRERGEEDAEEEANGWRGVSVVKGKRREEVVETYVR